MSDDFNTFDDGQEDSLLINLADVEESNFDAIPKGIYPVVVEECEFQISKSSQKPMWSMRFSVTDGEFANRKLFTYMSFSEKALPMTKTALGVLAPELLETAFDPRAIAADGSMTGRVCKVRVVIEPGQDGNEPRNAIKKYLSSEDGDGSDGFSM